MSEKKPVNYIDSTNWVTRTIPNINGDIPLVGLTVRALRKALENMDQDDLVCFMAEMVPEARDKDTILGVIAGAIGTGSGVVMLVGPEAVRAMKREGMI